MPEASMRGTPNNSTRVLEPSTENGCISPLIRDSAKKGSFNCRWEEKSAEKLVNGGARDREKLWKNCESPVNSMYKGPTFRNYRRQSWNATSTLVWCLPQA